MPSEYFSFQIGRRNARNFSSRGRASPPSLTLGTLHYSSEQFSQAYSGRLLSTIYAENMRACLFSTSVGEALASYFVSRNEIMVKKERVSFRELVSFFLSLHLKKINEMTM